MEPLNVVSAMLCQEVEAPDGPFGAFNIKGQLQEIVFVENYERPTVSLYLFVHLNCPPGDHQFMMRWSHEGDIVTFGGGVLQMPGDGYDHRSAMPVSLPCPRDGLYVLELEIDGTVCSRQRISVRRPSN